MRLATRLGALSVLVTALLLPTVPSTAATTAPLPRTVLKITSVDWQNRTGSVLVNARVKCTGDGTFTWTVLLEQRVRAHQTANVPCDGDGFMSTIELVSRKGRFHPGVAGLTVMRLVSNDTMVSGSTTFQEIRLSPR